MWIIFAPPPVIGHVTGRMCSDRSLSPSLPPSLPLPGLTV